MSYFARVAKEMCDQVMNEGIEREVQEATGILAAEIEALRITKKQTSVVRSESWRGDWALGRCSNHIQHKGIQVTRSTIASMISRLFHMTLRY